MARRRNPQIWSRAGGCWTHDLVGYALDRFHRLHLRTPTQREIRDGAYDLPSYSTIRRLYGSTGRMLAFHGYRVRRRGAQPDHPCGLPKDERGWFMSRPAPADARDD
jgi:hypothetical protein